MPFWFRVARVWLPLAVAVTATIGFAYVATQQGYRNGLNDPQTQMTFDTASRLDSGAAAGSVVPTPVVDIDSSLAPFVIIYSAANQPIAWSGTLGGKPPVPPTGVLDAARTGTPNKVTWQPRPQVRIASVSVAAADGLVVLAGRNMRDVESRVSELGKLAALAWLTALLGSLAAATLVEVLGKRFET